MSLREIGPACSTIENSLFQCFSSAHDGGMKEPRSALLAAPERGRYDRAATREQRQSEQRERVLTAILQLSAEAAELSIGSVVHAAGIGRNTFYEYFDDLPHALTTLRQRALKEFAALLELELQCASSSALRIGALSAAWANYLSSSALLARLALQTLPGTSSGLSAIGDLLHSTLATWSDLHDELPGLADATRIFAVAALFEVLGRRTVNAAGDDESLRQSLAEFAMKLLR